jgi:hypothetical protein
MKQWLVQTEEQNGNNRYLISRKYETVVGTNRRTKWKQPLSNLKNTWQPYTGHDTTYT